MSCALSPPQRVSQKEFFISAALTQRKKSMQLLDKRKGPFLLFGEGIWVSQKKSAKSKKNNVGVLLARHCVWVWQSQKLGWGQKGNRCRFRFCPILKQSKSQPTVFFIYSSFWPAGRKSVDNRPPNNNTTICVGTNSEKRGFCEEKVY